MISHLADRVAVMYVGRIVETGPTASIFARPRHPYTAALMASAPVPDPDRRRAGARIRLRDEVPDPSNVPAGCPFHPRCPFAIDHCRSALPALRPIGDQMVACHRAEDIALTL